LRWLRCGEHEEVKVVIRKKRRGEKPEGGDIGRIPTATGKRKKTNIQPFLTTQKKENGLS